MFTRTILKYHLSTVTGEETKTFEGSSKVAVGAGREPDRTAEILLKISSSNVPTTTLLAGFRKIPCAGTILIKSWNKTGNNLEV